MKKTRLVSIFLVLTLFMQFCWAGTSTFSDSNIIRTTKSSVNKEAYSTVKITYPIIKNIPNADKLNNEINLLVGNIENEYKKRVGDTQEPIPDLPLTPDSNALEIDYKLYPTANVISIRFSIYTNFYGAAHPLTSYESLNFDIKAGKVLSLEDISESKHFLTFLSKYSKRELTKKLSQGESPTEPYPQGVEPLAKNFEIWNLTSTGLLVTFPPYQVAAYAFGPQEVLIPYSQIKNYVREEYL